MLTKGLTLFEELKIERAALVQRIGRKKERLYLDEITSEAYAEFLAAVSVAKGEILEGIKSLENETRAALWARRITTFAYEAKMAEIEQFRGSMLWLD